MNLFLLLLNIQINTNMLHSNVLGPGASPKTPLRDARSTSAWIRVGAWLIEEMASGLGFNIPACSSGGLFQPPEVCDPHLHLAASQLISVVPRATKT